MRAAWLFAPAQLLLPATNLLGGLEAADPMCWVSTRAALLAAWRLACLATGKPAGASEGMRAGVMALVGCPQKRLSVSAPWSLMQ